MSDEPITVSELHAELEKRFGSTGWSFRNVFTPQNVGAVLVSTGLMLISGTALWLNLRHDVDSNTEDIARTQITQAESSARLDKRIEDEKRERREADARIEERSNKSLDNINDTLDELNRNIKTILQALPRQ